MYIDRCPNAYRYRCIRMVYRKGIFDIHGISLYTHKVNWISCYIPCISTNAISYVFLCISSSESAVWVPAAAGSPPECGAFAARLNAAHFKLLQQQDTPGQAQTGLLTAPASAKEALNWRLAWVLALGKSS